nr:hypothetical protein [Tanacetum cinerariifolium]
MTYNNNHFSDLLVIHKLCQVDQVTDDYMLMLNDEEKPIKSYFDDMELEQQPDNLVYKQPHVEHQPDDAKDKTIVLEENFKVKVDDKPCVATYFSPVKVKKKKCQHALRLNYVLRSSERRKKKLGMALKPQFGQRLLQPLEK